jgi:hypothetical protein
MKRGSVVFVEDMYLDSGVGPFLGFGSILAEDGDMDFVPACRQGTCQNLQFFYRA